MTKVNCLTSSDRKINIVVFPEQHECDVDICKQIVRHCRVVSHGHVPTGL